MAAVRSKAHQRRSGGATPSPAEVTLPQQSTVGAGRGAGNKMTGDVNLMVLITGGKTPGVTQAPPPARPQPHPRLHPCCRLTVKENHPAAAASPLETFSATFQSSTARQLDGGGGGTFHRVGGAKGQTEGRCEHLTD